jgi:hypothetical protein
MNNAAQPIETFSEAQDEIARLLEECEAGISDREAEALQIAVAWQIDEDWVKAAFTAARIVARALLDKKISPEPQPEVEEPEVEVVQIIEEAKPKPKQELVVVPQSSLPPEIQEKNDKHAIISNLGGKCVVMEWVPSPIMPGSKELSYQSFTSFRERYANQFIEVPTGHRRTERISLATFWLTHEQHRQYEGLDLIPNGPAILEGNYLNLWRGWGVTPQKGSWKLIERHIAEVLADGNQQFETYLRRLTAWKFQNPGLPPEVAVVLRGGKGAGKGAWGYLQMLIWGTHALQIFSTEHLCGKHNAHLQNKLFLFLDEALWAGDRHAERVLKGMITEKWMMIEPKNVNAFPWVNRLGLYMSANAKWVVPASHDERRFAVNNINESWKQNPEYFRPLFAEINNGGAAAMLYDLQSLDLDGWHPAENVPQTAALVEQKMLGLTGLEQWYVHLLNVGELPKPMLKNPRWVLSKNLLDNAKAHSLRNRYITSDELGSFMREMNCEHKSNGKAWGWIFPPLAEARETWSLRSGGTWQWLTSIADWGKKE